MKKLVIKLDDTCEAFSLTVINSYQKNGGRTCVSNIIQAMRKPNMVIVQDRKELDKDLCEFPMTEEIE